MPRPLAALAALALIPPTMTAPRPAADAPVPAFADATAAAGVEFAYSNGRTGELHLPEIVGGGAALFDADGDGDLDLYLVDGGTLGAEGARGRTGRLYRNDGGRPPRFTDVTGRSGIGPGGYGMGVAAGDYDNDGRVDLYLTELGPNRLLRNLGGGRFEDVTTRAGVADPRWSVSAAFFDYDRDGWLDLFVVNYAEYSLAKPVRCYAASSRPDYCGPRAFPPQPSSLFRNLGGGRFEDVSARSLVPRRSAHGLGVVTADLDGDGWTDVYVANDGDDNHLWLNQAGKGFREDGLLAGVALSREGLPEAGMGADAGDVDGDLDLDLFVTNLTGETNTLYVQEGGAFEDRSIASGLAPPSRPWTGFGTALLDYDNDGWLDVVAANGAVHLANGRSGPDDPFPLGQPSQLFRNLGAGTFREVTAEAVPAFLLARVSRGLAVGDLDDDGDPDLVVADNEAPARVLLNQVGQDRPWLGLRLVDAAGRLDRLGARVVLRRSGAPDLVRRVRTDGSYASAGDPRVVFGLGGGGEPRSIEVDWPDGRAEAFPPPPTGRYTTLRQGRGGPVARGSPP